MAGSLGEAQLQLTVDQTAFQAALSKAKLQTESFAAGAQSAFGKLNRTTVGLSTALGSLFAAAGAGALLKGAINEAVQLETITRKLANTLGKDGAGAAISFTKGLADQLGLSFKDLAGAFASFTAAASGAGVPLQQQKELFGAVAKAGQALGLSSYEISGSLLALQQVASKGVVQMEELRGQLGERLPIAFAAAAKGLGVTQQELIKLVETGQLSSTRFFPALTKGLNEMTASAGGTETTAQQFQKLKNSWEELQVAFGESLIPTVLEQVKNLKVVVEGLGIKFSADQLGFGTGPAGFLGIIPDAAVDAVAALRVIGQTANLSSKEMRALWYDALKAEGIKNPAFAKPDQIQAVIEKTRELAFLRKRSAVDTNAEAAEAQRLLAIAAARTEAENKLLKPAQEQLKAAQVLAGLDGQARQAAEAQLAIDQARAKYVQARAAANKAAAQPGNDAGAAKLEAAAQAAGVDLETAMIKGGEAMKAAAQSAADELKQAGDQLRNALRSNLDLLNKETRQRVLNEARGSLNKSLATGRFDNQAVLAGVKTNKDLIDMASKLEGINSSFDQYSKAQDNVARVQEQLDVSFKDLGVKMEDVAAALVKNTEAERNIKLNVTVNADGTYNISQTEAQAALY